MSNQKPSRLGTIKVGMRVMSKAGMTGYVRYVSKNVRGSIPSATVAWDNGHVGRVTVTNLQPAIDGHAYPVDPV
jgi:hypothetical protein